MYAVEATLAAALEGSHTACGRFTFLWPDRTARLAFEDTDSALLEGSVTEDLGAVGRFSGSVTLADPDGALSPASAADPAWPGSLCRVETGAVVRGRRALLPLGTFRISGFGSTMAGTLRLTLEDMLEIARQPYGDQVTIPDGTRAADAVVALLAAIVDPLGGGASWHLDDDGRTLPARTFLDDEEVLASVVSYLGAQGLQLRADRMGDVVLEPIPDYSTAASVRTIRQEPGVAVMTDHERSASEIPFNRVIVIAENPDRPTFRADVRVTDPASPIHPDIVGVRTAPVVRSGEIADQAACNQVAAAELVRRSLYQDATGSSIYPDPRLEAGDVVETFEPRSRTDGRYRLDRITTPVLGGTQRLDASKVVPVFA